MQLSSQILKTTTMGKRLHVAKEYKVEYALGDAFNYKTEEIHNLLDACCENEWPYTGEPQDDEFEVEKEDWGQMIEVIKYVYGRDSLITKDDNWFDDDGVKQSCRNLVRDYFDGDEKYLEPLNDKEIDKLLSNLQYFLDNAEPNESYLHLCFF